MTAALDGVRVLVTRERPGELGELLERRGAIVMHVPLIEIVEPADRGVALRAALGEIATYDWLVVTSAPGAERVAAAAASVGTKLAAVGVTTAHVLADGADRPVDLVPSPQRADRLAEQLIEEAGPRRQRILVVQGARAEPALQDRLRTAGHDVHAVVGYDTALRRPSPADTEGADALLLASGSAARAWVDALGVDAPPVVVAIGPSTARVARELGLKVSAIATDHSVDGLVNELERMLGDPVHATGQRRVKHPIGLQDSDGTKLAK